MWKRELVALLGLSSWCLVIIVWLFLAVPWIYLQFVIVVLPDHTHLICLFVGYCCSHCLWGFFVWFLLSVLSGFAIFLMMKRELVALL